MPNCQNFDPAQDVDDSDYDPNYVGTHRMIEDEEELELVEAAA